MTEKKYYRLKSIPINSNNKQSFEEFNQEMKNIEDAENLQWDKFWLYVEYNLIIIGYYEIVKS